jgi:hypothetical protein
MSVTSLITVWSLPASLAIARVRFDEGEARKLRGAWAHRLDWGGAEATLAADGACPGVDVDAA